MTVGSQYYTGRAIVCLATSALEDLKEMLYGCEQLLLSTSKNLQSLMYCHPRLKSSVLSKLLIVIMVLRISFFNRPDAS